MDALIAEYSEKFEAIYDNRTAGDCTWTGFLATFAFAVKNAENASLRAELKRAHEFIGTRELESFDIKDFLAWLVRLDDPADEQGVEDRRTVNLGQIIGKAKALLDGAS